MPVRVVSPRHQVSGLSPGKSMCQYDPAAVTAGFFFCLKSVQPQIRPHPYRRVSRCECFAGRSNFLVKVLQQIEKSVRFTYPLYFSPSNIAFLDELSLNLAQNRKTKPFPSRLIPLALLSLDAYRMTFHYTQGRSFGS